MDDHNKSQTLNRYQMNLYIYNIIHLEYVLWIYGVPKSYQSYVSLVAFETLEVGTLCDAVYAYATVNLHL